MSQHEVNPALRHGYVLVDKPAGPSSHAAVQQVRRSLGIGGRRGLKAGHAGTLDPFATGLLVVLIGRATRLMPYVVGHDKCYDVGVCCGRSTTTDDLLGDTVITSPVVASDDEVRDACKTLRMRIEQVPPAVSAIHVDGTRAYQRVRRGEQIGMRARPVRIDSIMSSGIERRNDNGPIERLQLTVACGSGAYMRALARDFGDLLGGAAHCDTLRRKSVGAWNVEDATAPEEVTSTDIRPAIELVGSLPRFEVDNVGELRRVARGQRLTAAGRLLELEASHDVAMVWRGDLVALARRTTVSELHPHTVFIDPEAIDLR